MSTTTQHTTPKPKPTYPQQWAAYNSAQIFEKQNVAQMLSELCESIHAPVQRRGRPRIPLADGIFCAVMKVYGGVSGRRACSDMREYEARGLIDRAPHYNSVFAVLEDDTITPILKSLIELSARALREVEVDFAVDSTGFSTRSYVRWFDEKHGKMRKTTDWVKAHVIVGVKTNVVGSVEITGRNGSDSKQYMPLLKATAKHFDVKEVSADKAYLGRWTLRHTTHMGADPFIPFKENSKANRHDALWTRYYDRFKNESETFYAHYHKRSNVESTFSMIKRKFGAFVRSKTRTAQVNEVLCKILCHNLCVVLEAAYEGWIDVEGAA